jgi:hypothetical protein
MTPLPFNRRDFLKTTSSGFGYLAFAALAQQQAEQIIASDPFVQQMVDQWGARIVSGSVKPWTPGQTV